MNTSAPKSKLHFERKVVTVLNSNPSKSTGNDISDATISVTVTHVLTLFNKRT
jgi:hypothetical protein